MTNDTNECDTPLSVKKKRSNWARLFVVIVLAVYNLVKAARVIDRLYQLIREWLTNL